MFSSSPRMEVGISAYAHNAGSFSFQLQLAVSRYLVKICLKLQNALKLYNCLMVASQLTLEITNQAVLGFFYLNLKIWDNP